MTVKELRLELQKYPDDLLIQVDGYKGDYQDPKGIINVELYCVGRIPKDCGNNILWNNLSVMQQLNPDNKKIDALIISRYDKVN